MTKNEVYNVGLGANELEFVIEPTGATTIHVTKTTSTSPLSVPNSKFNSPQEAISYVGNAIGKGQTHSQVLDSFTGSDATRLRQALQPVASTAGG